MSREFRSINEIGNTRLVSTTRFVSEVEEVPPNPPAKRRKTIISDFQCTSDSSDFLRSRIPLSGDYISVTFSDGQRRYLCLETESEDSLISCPKTYKSLFPNDLCKLVQSAENLV